MVLVEATALASVVVSDPSFRGPLLVALQGNIIILPFTDSMLPGRGSRRARDGEDRHTTRSGVHGYGSTLRIPQAFPKTIGVLLFFHLAPSPPP